MLRASTRISSSSRTAALVALVASIAMSAMGTSTADAQQRRRRAAAAEAPEAPRATLADLEAIVPRLQSTNPDEVREAIDLLTIIDRPQVVPHLAELLRSGRSDEVTHRALDALRALKSGDSIDVLVEFTNHRRVGARRRAYLALAAIDDRRIPALLERGLRDSDRAVRGAVALSLGEIGARGSLDLLFHAFERNVVEAAISIGKLGDEAAIERYTQYLGNEPLGVMLSGYDEFLKRTNISWDAKKAIVERLGEVAGLMVRNFLQNYLTSFPERIRDSAQREVFELVEETIRRIPEAGGGTTITGGEQ